LEIQTKQGRNNQGAKLLKDQVLDDILSIPHKDALLIPIRKDIKKLFENEEIKFQMSIKDNKIILESSKILQTLELLDNHQLPEITDVK